MIATILCPQIIPCKHSHTLTINFGAECDTSTRPLSSIHPNQTISDGEPLVYPFKCEYSRVLASCGDLWLIEHEFTSLFLWNPSIQTFRKLPWLPWLSGVPCRTTSSFGVGYDPASDDYKGLEFKHGKANNHVYSLRNNTWKETEAFPRQALLRHARVGPVTAAGALHWLTYAHYEHAVIISFDLSAEKYAEVPMLPGLQEDAYNYESELSVLAGKLCLAVMNDTSGCRIDVYVMEEYGVVESWAKVYEFECDPRFSYHFSRGAESGVIGLIPRGDDDALLPKALICANDEGIIRVIQCPYGYYCHLYTTSLVSPDSYCATPPP